MGKWGGSIQKRFSAATFEQYIRSVKGKMEWSPVGVTIHHTAEPSLADRPHGLTHEHIANLQYHYQVIKGWSAGPHVFTDQNKDGIWVLSHLTKPGVHAASFNSKFFGIEVLGDYDRENPIGEQWDSAFEATAVLMRVFGWGDPDEKVRWWRNGNSGLTTRINFHCDDPMTDKSCPGKLVSRRAVLMGIERALHGLTRPNEYEVHFVVDGQESDLRGVILSGTNVTVADAERVYGLAMERCPVALVGQRVPVATYLKSHGFTLDYKHGLEHGTLSVTRRFPAPKAATPAAK